ncbi:unnamed protein product [Choristocarpus tenellus]
MVGGHIAYLEVCRSFDKPVVSLLYCPKFKCNDGLGGLQNMHRVTKASNDHEVPLETRIPFTLTFFLFIAGSAWRSKLLPTSCLKRCGVRRSNWRCLGDQASPPPPTMPSTSRLMRISRLYTSLLESRPLLTKALTSAAIACAGDVTCQILEAWVLHDRGHPGTYDNVKIDDSKYADQRGWIGNEDGNGIDVSEGDGIIGIEKQRMASAKRGEFSLALFQIDWGRCARFSFLGAALVAPALHYWYALLVKRIPGTLAPSVAKRLAVDQFIFSPALMVAFFSSVMLLDGKVAKIPDKLRRDFWPTLVSNWGYWMPAQVVNFRLVPPMYQVLYANVLGFFWNIFLSSQSFKTVDTKSHALGEAKHES